jgi:regulator of sigma E protease
LTTFLAFLFVLGVLVFVHELGHFLAAKRVGIRVLKFQLGFNPTIVSFRRGDTEYGIGALPLGGYVKMAGESPEDTRTGQPDEFLSKSKWERFQVLIMGPAMNLALAVVLMAIVLYQGAEVPAYEDQPPVIGVVAAGSVAEKADIRPGDLVTSAAGRATEDWEDFYIAIGTRPHREVTIELVRDGQKLTRNVTPVPSPESRYDIGDIGALPVIRPKLVSIAPGRPGEKAGLLPGDIVTAVNGEAMNSRQQLIDAIGSRADQPITLSIERGGARHDIGVTPVLDEGVGRIGVSIGQETRTIQPGPIEAVTMSVERNVQLTALIFDTIWGLLTRETSPKQLMGPVAIAQLSGESAQLGWVALFSLMASISLNLGILNLLPIPVLDGGHILIMGLESVRRRDFSLRVKEKMLLAGFVVLMMLMVTVIYNDLTRISWIERLMPWR